MKISLLFSALSACVLLAGCQSPQKLQQRAAAVPVTASVRVSPHCGYGCGRGAVAHWPESSVHTAPEKGERV
ncbi:hypothetical protein R6Y29_003376 [Escherichia coli]|nr:hypothetical protein [Escherichia coli]EHI0860719.1 hypothetical protein [Escherichia coli]ELT0291644.1 hypothetical protein [Escherichia coli]